MLRTRLLALFLCFFAVAVSWSHAAQKVTLQSGTVLIGDVSIDGDSIVVNMDQAELRFPLKEIATIVPQDAKEPGQAQRLLLIALESRILRKAKSQQPALLAEAYRLEPEDPQIAFWYAYGLESAGYGSAAKKVLDTQRAPILENYPGAAEELEARIARKIEIERLPERLAGRIQRINETASDLNRIANDRIPTFAYFRITDDAGKPLTRSEFRVSGGYGGELATFEDGYCLYSYARSASRTSNSKAFVEITAMELEKKKYDVSGSSHRVRDAGKIIVKRFSEEDKVSLKVLVKSVNGDPIANSAASVRPKLTVSTSSQRVSIQTDAQGSASVRVFPGEYYVSVTAPGHAPASTSQRVERGAKNSTVAVKLRKAISAKVRVAWRSTLGKTVTEGESVLRYGGNVARHNVEPQWLRLSRHGDQLVASVVASPYSRNSGFGQGDEAWARLLAQGEEGPVAFENLELPLVPEVKQAPREPRNVQGTDAGSNSNSRGLYFSLKAGDVIAGTAPQYDHRYGPTQKVGSTEFKIYVESLETGDQAQDPPRR